MIWSIALNTARDQVQAEDNASYSDELTRQRIEHDCANSQGTTPTECVGQMVAAFRAEQRSEQDLAAQRGMERWAFWMLVVSLVGIALTSMGIFFVKFTLDEARKTTRAAFDSADHARASVDQAKETNRIAVESANIEQRPWLSLAVELTDGVQFGNGGAMFMVAVAATNYGKTPAIEVWMQPTIVRFVDITDKNRLSEYRDSLVTQRQTGNVSPAVVFPGRPFGQRWGCLLEQEEISSFTSINNNTLIPVLLAGVVYKSIYSDEWYSTTVLFDVFEKQEGSGPRAISPSRGSLTNSQVILSPRGSGIVA
ncbi:hypothetical protein [Mesorhizobium sp. M0715]|uniref:hypothetical protein n=1 Tax=Mesorhizobium sp. M0715 TaxID=2956990 RepID=UPI0033384A7C